MTLEQQLIALCEGHGLVHLNLNVTKRGDGDWMIYAGAQREIDGTRVAGSSGYDTDRFAKAVPEAIAETTRKIARLAPIEGLAA